MRRSTEGVWEDVCESVAVIALILLPRLASRVGVAPHFARACEKTKGCAAFTFIASQEKTAPKSKCWLKKAGYHRGAEHAVGTVSGVVRRE